MQAPNQKQLPVYLPEFLTFGIGFGLALLFDGKIYDDFPGFCQRCGSKRCIKHGFQEANFCKLIVKGKFVDINVLLQTYLCKDCKKEYVSNGPFYDDTMYGSQIVDLALALSTDNSSYGVEKAMMNFGIQLDSDSVLDYVRLFANRSREKASLLTGFQDPVPKLYAINLLKILFGANNVKELSEKFPDVKDLQSLMDETYLKKKGALRKFVEMIKRSTNRRVVRRGINSGKDIVIKDGEVVFPESFTLALSYLPGADAFASLICTERPFNEIMAGILYKALEGTTSTVTDGSKSYTEIEKKIGCAVHKTRNELKHDPKFKQMKNEAKELISKRKEAKTEEEKKRITDEYALKRVEMKKYAKDKYQQVVNTTVEQLKKERPKLFDENGNFDGYTNTNGMEGGNWRVKYSVRVPHERNDSSTGRSILAAIKDSGFVMRGGKVKESIANKLGFFNFGNIMTGVSGIQR